MARTTSVAIRSPTLSISIFPRMFRLHLNQEPREAALDGHRIRLEQLEPVLRSDKAVPQADYRATLTVASYEEMSVSR